jgi:AraC-like DNA-binding protein
MEESEMQVPTSTELFSSELIRIYDVESSSSPPSPVTHQAQAYEIVFTRRGAQAVKADDELLVGDVNSLVFLNRGQQLEFESRQAKGTATTIFAIRHPDLLKIIYRIEPQPENPAATGFSGIAAPLSDHRHLLRMHLLRARLNWPTVNPLEIEEQVFHLLRDVLEDAFVWWRKSRRSSSRRASTRKEHQELVMRTKLVLAENYAEGIGLEDIARAALSSPYHLSRIFKRHTGSSIHQYLQQLRLRNALERLITHPHEKLDVVAYAFGFSSHSHFSTLFLRRFGVSPSKFRQAMVAVRLRELVDEVPTPHVPAGVSRPLLSYGADLMPPAPVMSHSFNWMTFERFF